MQMQEIIVSVLMPAYNAEKYIGEAIDSVLNQTYTNIEFLIIDDGSTDSTVNEVAKFVDSRIRLLRNEVNRGLIWSLNRGLEEVKGKYIARMDADDICHPERLMKQVEFLEKNTDIAVLGTAHRILSADTEVHHPKFDEEIKLQLFRKSAFTHPSVMMRKNDLDKNNLRYRGEYKYAEDYGLWTDVAGCGLKLANLEDVLIDYRHHDEQVTVERRNEQLKVSELVQSNYFRLMTSKVLTNEEICRFNSIPRGKTLPFKENILILDKLYRANETVYKFHKPRFYDFICHQINDNLLDKKLGLSDFFFLFKKNVSAKLIFKTIGIYISKR